MRGPESVWSTVETADLDAMVVRFDGFELSFVDGAEKDVSIHGEFLQ
jgi:hypothetical protein